MVTAMATVGDFVAPRDRGHYQGIFGAVFRAFHRVGAADWRIFVRSFFMALDFLRQPAHRHRLSAGHQRRVSARGAPDGAASAHRLYRHRHADTGADDRRSDDQPGRRRRVHRHLPDRRACCRGDTFPGRIYHGRAPGAGAFAAPRSVPQPDFPDRLPGRIHRRRGAVRLDHADAGLSADGEGHRPHQRRTVSDAYDGGRGRHFRGQRPHDQPHRTLPDFPPFWARAS